MTTPELAPWLQRYFTEYLSAQRNVSHATIMAYRDTFRLLLNHLRKTHRRDSHTLPLEVLASDTILRFLDYLERQRGNSIRTRNARLAAIRSFVHYLSDWLGPELPVCVARILAIPFKRYVQEWRVLLYFLGNRHSLANERPLDLLRRGESEKVIRHATDYAQANEW